MKLRIEAVNYDDARSQISMVLRGHAADTLKKKYETRLHRQRELLDVRAQAFTDAANLISLIEIVHLNAPPPPPEPIDWGKGQ